MARGVNKVILVGNCGGDPETRYLPSGGAVTNITVATSESWNDKQTGEKQERTEWHRLVFFNKVAEIAGKYLAKGSKVYIEGQLRTRSYEKSGVKMYTTEIVVDEMQMLDSRGVNNDSPSDLRAAPSQPREQQQHPGLVRPAAQQAVAVEEFDDDIPF